MSNKQLRKAIISRLEALNEAFNRATTELQRKENIQQWNEAFQQLVALNVAEGQSRNMRWTATGDFSHLQSTGGVSFHVH